MVPLRPKGPMCPCKVPNWFPGSNYKLGEMDEALYATVLNGFLKNKVCFMEGK